jgi:1,4-dihydroxy-2-naphthoate octaprenyltransferase
MGAFYLQTQTMSWEVFLAAVAIALPIVGVLNLNNIRDIDNDRKHGKRTFASLLGVRGGKIYHTGLLITCLFLFAALGHFWPLVISPVWGWHIVYIFRHEGHELDKQMPVLMFTTILVASVAWL